jgi:hypothetical protein
MRAGKTHRWILMLCVGATFSGCQSAGDAITEPQAAATPLPEPDADRQSSTAVPTPVPQNEQSNSVAPTTVAQFTPPFPDRLELFEPPKRAQGAVRQNDNEGETVELKGFVNVDEPRVVLSIDGVISPIAEGGEKYGVQVISIQPPSVVLQRGRSRWTATLE